MSQPPSSILSGEREHTFPELGRDYKLRAERKRRGPWSTGIVLLESKGQEGEERGWD